MKLVYSLRAKEAIEPLKDRLQSLYRQIGSPCDDRVLAFEIAKRYDEELVENVCKPLEVSEGACLVLAVEAATGRLWRAAAA